MGEGRGEGEDGAEVEEDFEDGEEVGYDVVDFEYEGCDLEDVHFFGVVSSILWGRVWGRAGETVAYRLDGDEDDACERHDGEVGVRIPFR